MKLLFSLVFVAGTAAAEPGLNVENHNSDLQSCIRSEETQQTMKDEKQDFVQNYCCKVCKKGQACGNSCISWDKTCHQPPGCACQG